MVNPLIVALDVADLAEAERLARTLSDLVGGFKVGLELLMGHGPACIETIASLGPPVFVDAKLHDIPNTVRKAARQVSAAGARWVSVHASGGTTMIDAARQGTGGTGVLAVTVLTSLDQSEFSRVGFGGDIETQVANLVGIASEGGAEGVVCSPDEAALAKSVDAKLSVFTPGVRPDGADRNDQARVATPLAALSAGADYLVVGRPITGAADVVAAAHAVIDEINHEHRP